MATETTRAVGLFPSRQDAERALYRLRDTGFDMNKISVVARDETLGDEFGTPDVEKDKGEQAKGGAGAGAVAGTATGGLMGLFGSLGVLAIPGVGPLAEVGIVLANTLLGSGIGAAGGGLLGALIGWGVPEERAHYYNSRVYDYNDYLVLVEGTPAEIRSAEAVLNEYGIRDWGTYGPTAANRAVV
jgi:hypothetical protein